MRTEKHVASQTCVSRF